MTWTNAVHAQALSSPFKMGGRCFNQPNDSLVIGSRGEVEDKTWLVLGGDLASSRQETTVHRKAFAARIQKVWIALQAGFYSRKFEGINFSKGLIALWSAMSSFLTPNCLILFSCIYICARYL